MPIANKGTLLNFNSSYKNCVSFLYLETEFKIIEKLGCLNLK